MSRVKPFLSSPLCALALLSAFPAAAQDAPKQDDSIVVTGQRELPPKVVHNVVRQISTTVDGQLSRFVDPVCPIVLGLPDPYAGVVARRIRKVAQEAAVPVAGEHCKANLVVMIAADPDKLVKSLRKQFPALFAGLNSTQLHRALRDGPVHVWNTIELQNEDGQTPVGDGIMASTLTVKSASFITLPTQRVVKSSILVLDDDAALGKTLTQIADYAAMRTLAGARPPGERAGTDTILTLFDADIAAPPQVTLFDRGFLKGLYSTRLNARSTFQMGRISRQIARDSKKRAGED